MLSEHYDTRTVCNDMQVPFGRMNEHSTTTTARQQQQQQQKNMVYKNIILIARHSQTQVV